MIMDDYGWFWIILDHSEVLKTFEIFAISVQVTPAKRLELQRVNGSAEWIEWTWALVYTTILWHLMTRIFMRILRIYWWLLMRHTSRFSEWHSRQDKATMFKNHNLFLDIWWRLLCFIVCILGVWALTSFFAEKAHFCSSFRLESLEINRKKYVKFKKRTGTLSTTFFLGAIFLWLEVFLLFFFARTWPIGPTWGAWRGRWRSWRSFVDGLRWSSGSELVGISARGARWVDCLPYSKQRWALAVARGSSVRLKVQHDQFTLVHEH